MRVTKVDTRVDTKVKSKKLTINFKRDAKEGFLTHGDEGEQGYTEVRGYKDIYDFLLKHKKDSFNLSILNKTLVKAMPRRFKQNNNASYRDKELEKAEGNNLKTLEYIFNAALDPDQKEKPFSLNGLKELARYPEKLREYLGHKFKEPLRYCLAKDAKPLEVNLVSDLCAALQNLKEETPAAVASQLTAYKAWAKWFTQRKAECLAKSIANNAMPAVPGETAASGETGQTQPSKRQQALQTLEQRGTIDNDIARLETAFCLDELCETWKNHWQGVEKLTSQDLEKKPEKPKERLLGTPKDNFNFKRELKLALQAHQRKYVAALIKEANEAGRQNIENCTLSLNCLNLYSQEVTKYLALYFPLKTSDKKLNSEDIEYYLTLETVSSNVRSRLKNALQQYRMQQSKLFVHARPQPDAAQANALPALVNSATAQHIKIRETFGLKFFNACAFAANNLRNCLAPSETQDILSANAFTEAVNKCNQTETSAKLYLFFGSELGKQDFANKLQTTDDFKDFVWALRGSAQRIRNAITHFGQSQTTKKEDFYKKILQVKDYEAACGGNKEYIKQPLLCELLNSDLNNLAQLFGEKLKSAELYTYYKKDDIERTFSHFPLFSRPLAFIPSFNNVFKKGTLYCKEENNPLCLKHYFKPTDMKNEQEYSARRNALELVYQHIFIEGFVNDPKEFERAVNEVLGANKQQASAKGNKYAWAFHDVPRYDPQQHTPVTDYLSLVQQHIINEEAKKRARSETVEQAREKAAKGSSTKTQLNEHETGNFQNFLWQVFIKGFDNFLSSNESKYGFIGNPELQHGEADTARQRAEYLNSCAKACEAKIKHNISANENAHLAFWAFCRLLDSRTLNELSNQFSKMLQAEAKNITTTNHKEQIELLQEIIALCQLTADNVPARCQDLYRDKEECLEHLKNYVQGELLQDKNLSSALYFQEDKTTPVVHASVELCRKYATAGILREVLSQHKVSQECVKNWQDMRDQNLPATWSKEREELHKAWVNAKATSKTEENKWLNENIEDYRKLCDDLEKWNWHDNQVRLVHVRDLHQLLAEIMGRFMGFAALFERDLRFYNAWLCSSNANFKKFGDELDIRDFPQKELLYANFLDKANVHFASSSDTNSTEPDEIVKKTWKEKCNYIAHLNYITQNAKGISILDMLFYLRALMGYDRKLKNAVAKSFVTLLERHGIVVKFKALHKNKHRFEIEEISAKNISHLGGKRPEGEKGKPQTKPVTTPARHAEYVQMVRALLEHKLT